MTGKINIRRAKPQDYPALGGVFFAAVRDGAELYTEAERKVWASQLPTGEDWSSRLAAQDMTVAETDSGTLIGFTSMDARGYADFAYILLAHQGQGLFRRLYTPLEQAAIERGITQFSVHASLHARPAFAAVGYLVTEEEIIEIEDERIQRFVMAKQIS